MSEFGMVPLSDKGFQRMQEIEGESCRINRAMANQFFMQTTDKNGEPQLFVKAAGLQWKMDELYGQNNYDFDTELLAIKNPEGYKTVKKELGIPDNALCVITVTELWLPGKKFPIREYGTVLQANIKGNKHPIELSITRAENRAMRKATRRGFVGKYEYAGDMEFSDHGKKEYDNSKEIEEQKKKALTRLQIYIRANKISPEQQLRTYNKIAEPQRQISSSTELSYYELTLALADLIEQKNQVERKERAERAIQKWGGQVKEEPLPELEVEEVAEAEVIEAEVIDEADLFIQEEQSNKEQDLRNSKLQAIDNLFTQLQWPPEKQGETIKKANVSSVEDLSLPQMDALINHLYKILNSEPK